MWGSRTRRLRDLGVEVDVWASKTRRWGVWELKPSGWGSETRRLRSQTRPLGSLGLEMGCWDSKTCFWGDFGSFWGIAGGFKACLSSYDVAGGVGTWQMVCDASAGVDIAAGFGVLPLSNGAGAGSST